MCVPALDNIEANSLAVIHPLLFIKQCVLYGRYGITPTNNTGIKIIL